MKVFLLFIIALFHSNFLSAQNNDWFLQPSPLPTSTEYHSVFFVSETLGWAVGRSSIIMTEDGGNNWINIYTESTNVFTDIYFISENVGWCTGTNGSIIKTTDGGLHWFKQPFSESGVNESLISLYFVNDTTGFAVGYYGTAFKTTDGGDTWLRQSFPNNYHFMSVKFTDESTGWILSNNGTIFKTIDTGVSWQIVSDLSLKGVKKCMDLTFVNQDEGWVVGEQLTGLSFGVIYHTIDGGISWTMQNDNSQFYFTLNSVYFVSQEKGWCCGFNGEIIKTIDGGNTWLRNSSTLGSGYNLNAIYFITESIGWAVGNYGTIVKTNNGGTSSIKDSDVITKGFTLYNNYPNPFNPSTRIQYEIPYQSLVTLKIYDVLGREVTELVNEEQPAGNYKIDFYPIELSSGIYFYQLQAKNLIKTKKMLLIK